MSLEIKVYCTGVSRDLVPQVMKRLNDYDMYVEVHPDFKFDQEEDAGFVPFKFRLKDPHLDILKEKELKSGFELYVDDFDLDIEKQNLQPKPGLLDKLRGKKQGEVVFAPLEIEARLRNCKKVVSFVWHGGESFQLRFASLTSAILTELTNGVCCYTANDIWYDNENIVDIAFKEVIEYEKYLSEEEIEFDQFDEW